MGENEIEFRKQIRVVTNDKSSIPDTRSAQQRAIDGLGKMTPRKLDTIMNQRDNRDRNIQNWAKSVGKDKTPIVSEGEQGFFECDRDGE